MVRLIMPFVVGILLGLGGTTVLAVQSAKNAEKAAAAAPKKPAKPVDSTAADHGAPADGAHTVAAVATPDSAPATASEPPATVAAEHAPAAPNEGAHAPAATPTATPKPAPTTTAAAPTSHAAPAPSPAPEPCAHRLARSRRACGRVEGRRCGRDREGRRPAGEAPREGVRDDAGEGGRARP